ncbi:hypothetical protein CDAR_211951 [Caerostris darwini]|uniref:Uncharacterized protein n=1 Tax=Caerostris darwini TaxID=1538125 RepID=A0AAV4PCR2_9ARAC|nr:hypothetical protein CDAR_211951 [Caerostris darwini]
MANYSILRNDTNARVLQHAGIPFLKGLTRCMDGDRTVMGYLRLTRRRNIRNICRLVDSSLSDDSEHCSAKQLSRVNNCNWMTNNGILPLFGQCVRFHGCYRIVRNRQLDEDRWKRASRAVKIGLALGGWGWP